ncbi:MAG: SCO family protein [Thermoanaerobaculia bacterium]
MNVSFRAPQSARNDTVAAFLLGAARRQALPIINFIDDTGRARSTELWRGTPTILVPVYTRCPSECLLITRALKHGVLESKANPATYRVVLFSFDPRDTPADLRAFRDRERVPLPWTIATARPEAVRRLMDAIGFQYADANGRFLHPSFAVALTPDLEPAKTLAGSSFDGDDIDRALAIARGGRDWIGDYGAYALAVLLLFCTLSAVYAASLSLRPRRTLG